MNMEVFLIVFGGTALLNLICERPPDRDAYVQVLRNRALMLGGITTLVGMILMLNSIDDVAAVPRRLALCLTGLFYGIILSEVMLAPLQSKYASTGLDTRGGMSIVSVVGATAMFSFMTILYALSACLDPFLGCESGFEYEAELASFAPRFSGTGAKLSEKSKNFLTRLSPILRKLQSSGRPIQVSPNYSPTQGMTPLEFEQATSIAAFMTDSGLDVSLVLRHAEPNPENAKESGAPLTYKISAINRNKAIAVYQRQLTKL